MKKALLIALFAAMPIMAQECPQKPCCADKKPCCMKKMQRPQLTEEQKAEMKAKFMEKFDADKDGQISDAEKAAIKADFEAKKAEMKAKFEAKKAERKAKFMEKFDTDKDGQISDAEKEAIKAEFAKRGGKKGPKFGKKGPRRPGCCGKKGPKGQRPQLTEEQKAEMKAKFEAKKAERKAKFMEKFDTDKDGKISDAEKEAIKAEFKKNAPKFRKHGRHGKRCCNKCAK